MVGDFNTFCPQDSSDIILKSIKNSNLHFIVNETPFSVYITIRKKFLTFPFPPNFVNGRGNQPETSQTDHLLEENATLKDQIKEQNNAKRDDEEIIGDLADKLAKAKFEISDCMSKKPFS